MKIIFLTAGLFYWVISFFTNSEFDSIYSMICISTWVILSEISKINKDEKR